MGIRLEQPGAAAAAAGAGAAIGKAKRAEEDRARAEREQARAQQISAQQEARKAAMKWEQEKMAMRSQQDFQQELTAKQWEFEKFNRAKAWEIDKMELSSRMDFERDEKKRAQEIDAFINGVESIKKSDTIDDEGKKRALHNWANKYPDVEDAAQYLGYAAPQKPPSGVRQKGEIEAAYELEGYTPDDLRELGLDPADFPGIGEYGLGQIVSTPQGDMEIVGFDEDGEPLVESVKKAPSFRGRGAGGGW